MKKSLAKKIFSIISIVILIISVIIFSIIVVARARGEIPGIFGYSFHIVVTDSMTPEIVEGDMVICRKTPAKDIKEGDDILFTSPDPALRGITIVHRVIQVLPDGGLVTQGIKQGAPVDTYPVYSIKGKAVAVSSFFGKVFMGLTNNRNIVFGAALLALLAIISSEIITIVLEVYRKKLHKNNGTGADTDNNGNNADRKIDKSLNGKTGDGSGGKTSSVSGGKTDDGSGGKTSSVSGGKTDSKAGGKKD